MIKFFKKYKSIFVLNMVWMLISFAIMFFDIDTGLEMIFGALMINLMR